MSWCWALLELKHGRNKEKRNGFVCLCGSQFSTKSRLYRHFRKMTEALFGKPDFKCEKCSQRYKSPHSLKAHMVTMHNEKWYGNSSGCRFCGDMFKTRAKLLKHQRDTQYVGKISQFSFSIFQTNSNNS